MTFFIKMHFVVRLTADSVATRVKSMFMKERIYVAIVQVIRQRFMALSIVFHIVRIVMVFASDGSSASRIEKKTEKYVKH